MSNFAALIAPLSISGSRLSDGTANASGTVWFFQPGGNTTVNVYSDAAASAIVTQPITLNEGGKLPSDLPDGVFVTQPVRILIQDVNGTEVTDNVYIPATAGNVGVDNDGFTDSTLDAVLDDAFTSFGGTDFKYLIASGQTERKVRDAITELGISVKAFGAKGDNVAIDTTAIQAALNYANAAGGGAVLFPPGTYKIDQALTLSSAAGVSIRGTGTSASKIVTTHASANVLTISSCTGFVVDNIGISATATNSGSALSLTSCTYVTLRNVLVNNASGGTFLIPIALASCSTVRLDGCDLYPKQADAAARTAKLTDSTDLTITGGAFRENAGAAMEFAGTTGRVSIIAARFVAGASGSPKGLLWAAAASGQDFTVVGCLQLREGIGLYSAGIDMSNLTTDPRLRQYGNGQDGYAEDVASGGTVTPTRSRGTDIRYRGTTTGAAYIVNAPVPTPVAGDTSGMRDTLLRLAFHNNAAGAVTGWTLNAAYHTTGAISTTDTQITTVTFQWDATSSVWREISRAVTT